MNGRKVRRRAVVVYSVVGVALVAAAALMITAGTAGAKSIVQPVTIQGNTYDQVSNVNGTQVIRQDQISMSAQLGSQGPASGWFEDQAYTVGADGSLTQRASFNVKVQCLSADKATHTVWFSGTITAAVIDPAQPAEEVQQEQSIIAAGHMILFGRLRDTNNDGSADQRSILAEGATTPYPNALLTSADNGTVWSPWFVNGNGTSADTACLLHDGAFQNADYQVVDGPSNQVQWLDPSDDTTPIGNPFTGTAAALAAPPAQAQYNLAAPTRTLLSPTLYLKMP
jgi:hypothetical protein